MGRRSYIAALSDTGPRRKIKSSKRYLLPLALVIAVVAYAVLGQEPSKGANIGTYVNVPQISQSTAAYNPTGFYSPNTK